ncbi:MAG: hypothetical protein L6R37_004481 [Teloschistes peruensis]|nr:MAG: hypothetical protein L6R37_004481 [Teloschistes peruensis]
MHPFQRLLICTLDHGSSLRILLAATKSRIFSFSLQDGSLISVWRSTPIQARNGLEHDDQTPGQSQPELSAGNVKDKNVTERPTKRQKRAPLDDASESSSAEIVTEDGKPKPSKSIKAQASNPNLINLAGTSDGQYVIAVTDEDKCVRVLRLDVDGKLQQLSKRSMPKKPCAITLTPDESTIICGDKFGDVYALPLLPDENNNAHDSTSQAQEVGNGNPPPVPESFLPSANIKTVHTLRNQKTLQHQKSLTNRKPRKNVATFEHKLLLGHVSLLTDVLCVSVSDPGNTGAQERTYIITADRDEHIRVSRGIPQSHVIEGFCLGHNQFVSQLCVPSWDKRILISGGGDNYLLVWDWLSSRVLYQIDLRTLINDFTQRHCSHEIETAGSQWQKAIAVSKILAVESSSATGIPRRHVIIICESMDSSGVWRYECSKAMQGNVVDIAYSAHQNCIVYAVDTVHQASSQSQVQDGKGRLRIGTLQYSVMMESWEVDLSLQDAIGHAIDSVPQDDEPAADEATGDSSESLLYNLEKLRKRYQEE